MKLVSIVVPTTRFGCLRTLLNSIERNTERIPYEVVVVSFLPVPSDIVSRCRVITEDKPAGCVKAYNLGFRAARGHYLVHLNDDMEVCQGWLSNMLSAIGDRPVLGAFAFAAPRVKGYVTQELWGKPYANFGCITKSLMETLGYWDERFVHYGADSDFGLPVWHRGHQVIPVPAARVIHWGVEDEYRKEELRTPAYDLLCAKWKGIYVD